MLQERDDIVALDSAILQHPRVWEASGHLAGFTDPLVDCKPASSASAPTSSTGRSSARPSRRSARGEDRDCELTDVARVQPDVRDDGRPGQGHRLGGLPAPRDRAGHLHQLQERPAVRAQEAAVRDRPGRQVVSQRDHARQLHLPHARVRADGDGVLRAAGRGAEDGSSTGARRASTGTPRSASEPDMLRLRPHDADELSHYSSGTSDVEYLFPIGWSELEGIANRGDFDLTQHAEFSGEKLEYFDQQSGERYVPHVIEPAAGADRATLAFLVDAYDVEEVEGRERTVLRLHPRLAPVKVAVLPLVNKEGMPERAREIFEALRPLMQAEYDEGGSIGKRYRRQDEIGTPVGRHDRRPDARGRHRHPARPRLARAGARGGRGSRRACSARSWPSRGRARSRPDQPVATLRTVSPRRDSVPASRLACSRREAAARAHLGVDELHRVHAEPARELAAAEVRLFGDLEDGVADLESGCRPAGSPRSGRGRRRAGRPPGPTGRDRRPPATSAATRAFITVTCASGFGPPSGGRGARPVRPHVADQPGAEVELAGLEDLALLLGRAADDQLERSCDRPGRQRTWSRPASSSSIETCEHATIADGSAQRPQRTPSPSRSRPIQ